jgi:hypothetical protein
MSYTLTAKTIIESATLDLTGQQLKDLAAAEPVLDQLITFYAENKPQTSTMRELLKPNLLTPVADLLKAIGALVDGATEIKTKKLTGGAALKAINERKALEAQQAGAGGR